MGSPLMIGCDIREMTPETKAVLTNRDLLAPFVRFVRAPGAGRKQNVAPAVFQRQPHPAVENLTADCMAESGLLDAGYEYLVIDDCWSLRERDENERLVCLRNKMRKCCRPGRRIQRQGRLPAAGPAG